MKMIQLLFVVLSLFCFETSSYSQCADSVEMECIPSLAASLRVKPPLDFCGEAVPLYTFDTRERLERELLLMLWNRDQTIMWIKRSNRFMPYIQAILKEKGLPDDLKYIPIIESSLRALAGSPKGAMGYWQFIKDTGERYGLTITEEIDERRNMIASTQAALAYFKKLHDDFGSWTLAAAAYNMGEQGLKNEITLQENTDFYNLYLYQETQRYVFRILAAKLILSQPEKFGFKLTAEDLYPPEDFDRIQIELSQKTPVLSIARAARTTFKAIRDMNPEIRGYSLPKGSLMISIPRGSAAGFLDRLAQYTQTAQSSNSSENIYIVKNGDSLYGIAERFNVPISSLLTWNQMDTNESIHPGDRLVIHSNIKPSN